MLKNPLMGFVLQETPDLIVIQEGEAVASYTRELYRRPIGPESEPLVKRLERKLPVVMTYGLHGILAPVNL